MREALLANRLALIYDQVRIMIAGEEMNDKGIL